MPTIRRFGRCKIAIYADDHLPPHIHIEGRGFRIVVEIEDLSVRAGDARKLRLARDAMEWASQNTNVLWAEWRRLNRRG